MFPTVFEIINTIKGFFNGENNFSNIGDILDIPVAWIESTYRNLFEWFLRIFDVVKPYFAEAGESLYDVFKIDSINDIESAFFFLFGIAGFLLIVKLCLWFLGG